MGNFSSSVKINENKQKLRTYTFHIPSMHCSSCMSKIERQIGGLQNVLRARVNLTLRELKVISEPSVSSSEIVTSLQKIGFKAKEIGISHIHFDDNKEANDLLRKLAAAGFGMMNVILLSIAVWSGADTMVRQYLNLMAALISVPILIYASQPFLTSAFWALRNKSLNMDVPISLAIILTVITSFHEAMNGSGHIYFDAALSLTFFLLVGRYLEMRSSQKASSAAAQLAQIQNPIARLKKDDMIQLVNVNSLEPGMIIILYPSERVPADGKIIKGRVEFDRSFLTGESLPVMLSPGSTVFAGEICLNGNVEIKVSKHLQESMLSRFIDLIELAEQGNKRYQNLANRAASFYAPAVHILAVLAFSFWWWISKDSYFALTIAISVLIITCPCALGLAVPVVVATTSGRLFVHRILLKNKDALERLAMIDTVVFDKTGTLTTGKFRLSSLNNMPEAEQALLVATAEASQHPLAKAIISKMRNSVAIRPNLDMVKEVPGCGVEARINGELIRLGKPNWLDQKLVDASEPLTVAFRYGKRPLRWLSFDEIISPEITEMLAQLDSIGIKRMLLTGDNLHITNNIAKKLGFNNYQSELSPEEKLNFIKDLKECGYNVLMVGDGLNDIGAMSAANASVASASALDATQATADVILLDQNLKFLPFLLKISKMAKTRILQNFFAAAIYNFIAIPLAFAGFISPLLAAIVMSASSLTVVLNATRPGVTAYSMRSRKNK